MKNKKTTTGNKNMPTKRYKKRESGTERGSVPQGPGDTIRLKMEDKLTEEKLKDRESATHPNTPWAPSAPKRMEVPAASFRSGPIGTVGCKGQGAWYFLRVIC